MTIAHSDLTGMAPTREKTEERAPCDHNRVPILEGIARYLDNGVLPFSTPGHKRGVGMDADFTRLWTAAGLALDIPLGGGVDDTNFDADTRRIAEDLAADAWGADRTFFMVNGSSAGNHAFLLAMVRPGDEVIMARDIHKSLMVALILSGANPVWVTPKLHSKLNVGLGVDPADISQALDEHPNAKLVALVSPSYCGVSSDLKTIAGIAHARSVPVYVDEAWGPHIHFHPDLPPSAMASGVDGAVASTHKMLASLTQSSILNVQGPLVDVGRIQTAVGMVNTTSPAAMILASIDVCRRQMALHGEALLANVIALANRARMELSALPGVTVHNPDVLGIKDYDLTKLVIDVHGLGLTGFQAEDLLRNRFFIQPESSDFVSVVCFFTVGDTEESANRLISVFQTLSDERAGLDHPALSASLRSSGVVVAPGRQAMSPRDAFFAKSRTVTLAESVGKISAELVIPYPPGIPVLAPGDIIEAEKIEFLLHGVEQGMHLSGPSDPHLKTLNVVAET
jgi:arginine/lysine/ornithine decarboxylase